MIILCLNIALFTLNTKDLNKKFKHLALLLILKIGHRIIADKNLQDFNEG